MLFILASLLTLANTRRHSQEPSCTSNDQLAMERYGNLSGNSGVIAYEIRRDAIAVQFEAGPVYLYTYASAGRRNIEKMKTLAVAGKGLSTFIVQQVREAYAAKLA